MDRFTRIAAAAMLAAAPLAGQAPTFGHAQAANIMTAAWMSMIAYGTGDNAGSEGCNDGRTDFDLQANVLAVFSAADVKFTRVIREPSDQLFAFVFAADGRVVLAFRGSCGPDDSPNNTMNRNGAGSAVIDGFSPKWAHYGWANAMSKGGDNSFYDRVANTVRAGLQSAAAEQLLITGHSMGGAMAQYFTHRFLENNTPPQPLRVEGRYVTTQLYTFGAPRAGYGCGQGLDLKAVFDDRRNNKNVYSAAFEIAGDNTPASTEISGACPKSMGDVVPLKSQGGNAHNIRNYVAAVHEVYFKPNWNAIIGTDLLASPQTSFVNKIPFTSISYSWAAFPGAASSIAMGANGVLWAIGTAAAPEGGNQIWKFENAAWKLMPGAAQRIAVDAAGNAWVVNSKNEIYRWDTTRWVREDGSATDIAVGGPGNAVWIVGTEKTEGGYVIRRRDSNGGWAVVPGGATRIAVDGNGTPWAINESQTILRRTSSGAWQDTNGRGSAISASKMGVCVIGLVAAPAGGMKPYCYGQGGWEMLTGGAKEIAVGPEGRVFVVNDQGRLFASR